jgi:hypothetical protein
MLSHDWKAVFACAVALIVSGCGVIQQRQQAAQQAAQQQNAVELQLLLDAAEDKCAATYPKTKRTNAVPRARCFNEASDRFTRPNYPFPDLLDLAHANSMVLAEKVEKGQLTEAEAAQQYAAMASQVTTEAQRRILANRAVSAQETASEAQRQAAFAQRMQAISAATAPLERPNVPAQRGLTSSVNCTSRTEPNLPQTARVTTTNCQ